MTDIIPRTIEYIQRLLEIWIAVRTEIHHAIAVKTRKRPIGASLHADLRPEIVIPQQRLQHMHGSRKRIAMPNEISPLANILYPARRRQAFIERLQIPVIGFGRIHRI